MNIHKYLLITLLLLASCGGESNGGLNGAQNTSPSSTACLGVNRGMSGTLISVKDTTPWALDLYTGKVTAVKQNPSNWGWHYENSLHDSEYHNLAQFGLTPTVGINPGYVLGVNGCWLNSSGSCIVFFDNEFNRRSAVRLNYNIYKRPVESMDGKYIATQLTNNGHIVILDTDNYEVVRNKEIDSGGIGQVDMAWRSDGTLAYTKNQSRLPRMYVIDPTDPSEDGYFEFDLPDGALEAVRFSADGKKTLIHQRLPSVGSVIYMGSGGKITRVALQGDSTNSGISSPELSPDGEWITFLVGKNDLQLIEGSNRGYLAAVPSNAIDVTIEGSLYTNQLGPAFRISTNSAEVFGASTSVTAEEAEKWFGGDKVFWLP